MVGAASEPLVDADIVAVHEGVEVEVRRILAHVNRPDVVHREHLALFKLEESRAET
jgi:hypothetical protein